MRVYELVLVLRPSLKDADRKKVLDAIKDFLKDLKITKENDWGQKPLAYTIKKELAGYYYQILFEGESIAKDFETRLIRNDNVLRHLLLRTK